MYSVPSHPPLTTSSRLFWTVAVGWAAGQAVLGWWCMFMYLWWSAELEPMFTLAPVWLVGAWVWYIVGVVVVPRTLVHRRPRPTVILVLQGTMLVILLCLTSLSERMAWSMIYEQYIFMGDYQVYPVVALITMLGYTWYLRRSSTNLNPAKDPERE